jgi:hypothetical protein
MLKIEKTPLSVLVMRFLILVTPVMAKARATPSRDGQARASSYE